MRTTLEIDDALLDAAREMAPALTKTALVEAGLRAFVKQEARRRIAEGALHQPDFVLPPRRRVS